ncbi:uncharacterized protein GGS25DRAFT_526449 [Hypoxylon fragiforme]|uniref:uncharacterized protein n=1 Tax=Hypoxylon fragiforme TaxID=63214 RepID=UPI0020C6B6DE|nr:uncharacterized protein GGS25DRAFT_526449 [Hypoxylon fragiforme]KAI2603415.1 hypothetical protein GGS25DRAFT_526449 [Hypoxylon fragiforme]
MDFQYVNGKPSGWHEKKLRKDGWRWVNTNSIGPTTQAGTHGSTHAPDRLEPHSHHSLNTHLVVQGDLTIKEHRGRSTDPKDSVYATISSHGGYPEHFVKPQVKYSATSKAGCTFVEGHRSLSPSTAERFMARGALRATESNGDYDFAPYQDTIRSWLRSAKFNPRGKARPCCEYCGQLPILEYAIAPRSDLERWMQEGIAKWFENEWRKSSC